VLWKYAVRRLLASIPVVIGVSIITFLLLHVTGRGYVPGITDDPRLSAATVEALRHEYGLDQPWWQQYLGWLWNLVHGDFGRSMTDGTTVTSNLLERLPNTFELTLTAISSGATSAFAGGDLLDRISHLILPATVLSFGYIAVWSRFTRSSMLEILSQDYVRTARAKGMAERRVLYLHALRNAVIPLVTLVGLELPGLFSGGVVVEVVFGWPGVGRYTFERALAYDYTTVMGLTTFFAVLVVAGNLLADVLYAVLDPRIRYR
jgi:peptide/nickel transport system permease protein